jgi:hypothetical protein
VRAYLDPLHLERAELTKFTEDVGPVLAVACGDLGVGGERQLVLVTDKEVASGHLARGRFIAAHHAAARSLGQRLPVPFREPIATAAIVDSALFVGWGDRSGASMRADLAPVDHLGGLPVAAGNVVECVELDPPHGSIGDEPKRCSDADAPATPRTGRPLLDAWTSFDLARPDGATERVVASHEPTGLLHLSGHGTATVPDVGAQVGVADLDEDGVPEVVTTNARGEDALVISSWRAGGVATRLRWAAPAGVDAVAVCPPESSDRPAMVVAAVGKELWLVR